MSEYYHKFDFYINLAIVEQPLKHQDLQFCKVYVYYIICNFKGQFTQLFLLYDYIIDLIAKKKKDS